MEKCSLCLEPIVENSKYPCGPELGTTCCDDCYKMLSRAIKKEEKHKEPAMSYILGKGGYGRPVEFKTKWSKGRQAAYDSHFKQLWASKFSKK